ncbi:methionine synthase [Mycobacterium sp. CBMA 234]|uniref:methionine synthase n=1 Tax=Mycolicibacterium sp. CBMA 234 TaxID=1918495 RepID=UPI001390B418|nr:methionine synthase [Mycolicibacterium sp. CBMA 234]MUL63649.1 methionine synthase [Mycolicibacterium sp. CBMA 234]
MTVFAQATGIGSWPGTVAREAAAVVVGELPALPHLVELPARGIGADMIGRAGALLVDIGIDTVPRGYRIAPGRSSVVRRAAGLLDEDVDALEEAWEKAGLRGTGRTIKVQVPGPLTLAAELELSGGHRAITDPGALRDLAGSLAEGVARHRAEVARRCDAEVVVQYDEPSLPAALAGRLAGVTRMSPVAPVDELLAANLLDECLATVGGAAAIHVCAADMPWKMLARTSFEAISVDASKLSAADLDGIGEWVEMGRTVMLGVLPGVAPERPVPVEKVAAAAASVTDRLGFPRAVLRERIGLTPACGLAGATEKWARTALALLRKAANGIAEDPDAA